MIRKSRVCVFILAMIALVLILLIGQPDRVYQHFSSGLLNSVIHIKTNTSEIGGGKSMSNYNDMELYLRMTSSVPMLINLYENVLVRSLRYFWPDISSIVVVLDREKTTDHMFGNFVRNTFPFPRICYMQNFTDPGYSGKGRMQRDMFYPERCTSKKYVAFVDTDTVFITRIVPEMLFANGKPIVIGVYGREINQFWSMVAQTTAIFFKTTKEVMRCMTYFPVVLKVEHIIHCKRGCT